MSTAEKIEAIFDLADEVDGTVEEDYSGRGMYGSRCYGVICDDQVGALMAAGRLGLPRPSLDNMGRGVILYWPSIRPTARATENQG